eukprot:gene20483-22499_t
MARNIISSQPGMVSSNARWPETLTTANEHNKTIDSFKSNHNQATKMKEEQWPIQGSRSPASGDAAKADREQKDIARRDKSVDKNLRCEEMMPTLDYFMHGAYPYGGFNFQSRRDSPPDIMVAERCKQVFTRAGHPGFIAENARNMQSDSSKLTAEQVEAIYKSQGMGIPVAITPPEFSDRSGLTPAGMAAQQQRPSPQTEMQQGELTTKAMSFIGGGGMEDQLLRISDAEKAAAATARKDFNSAMFPGVINRMPTTSQHMQQSFQQQQQGLNIHPHQNNARFPQEVIQQATFGVDPRFFEQQSRAYQMTNRNDHPSPGAAGDVMASSQRLSSGRSANDVAGNNIQKKSLQVPPPRPMALGECISSCYSYIHINSCTHALPAKMTHSVLYGDNYLSCVLVYFLPVLPHVLL